MMTHTWTDVWSFRATLYSSLASYLLEPIQKENKEILSRKFWEDFPIEAANPKLQAGLDQLIACTSKLDELSTDEAVEKVMVEYTELFLGPGVPKAPPIESFYRSGKKYYFGPETTAMKYNLNRHGLESKNKDKEPEDHLGLELLFVSMLTEKLLSLEEKEHMTIIREQIPFMGKHLIGWIPELCEDAKKYGSVGFYGGLIEVIWGILLWDKELLEEYIYSQEYVLQ